MNSKEIQNHWEGDLLDYAAAGDTFKKLIQTIDDSRVISIEAGFGHGKTFFRKAWVKQLSEAGEVVVEIDAQRSDHSGDPVVMFLSALLNVLEPAQKSFWAKAISTSSGIALGSVKLLASVAARKAGEEIIESIDDYLQSDGETSHLEEVVKDFGEQASRTLGAQLTAQLEAERVRTEEMPVQMAKLREALTDGKETERVIIVIDELDRCHPQYAIALLEAMKLIFNQDGYIFVLMANAERLEVLAETLFGKTINGERYLDKFVDLRLKLPLTSETIANATRQLILQLPLKKHLGDPNIFGLPGCAEMAKKIVMGSKFSMRQIKRVSLKLELAMRCYPETKLDATLLVLLAFEQIVPDGKPIRNLLSRSKLTRSFIEDLQDKNESRNTPFSGEFFKKEIHRFARTNCMELMTLPEVANRRNSDGKILYDWAGLMEFGKTYVEQHENIINSIEKLSAD